MARIKLVYLGGGSTRAAGTMASFMHNGADFDGSEVVLVDLDPDRLALIRTLAERMARARGLDITVTATANRREALQDADAVLSSFRPGGFEARILGRAFRRWIKSEPLHDIGAVDSGRNDVEQHLVMADDGVGNLTPPQYVGVARFFDDDGMHGLHGSRGCSSDTVLVKAWGGLGCG